MMKKLFISLLALGLSQLCFAGYYQRGYQICLDFAEAKQWHENKPESARAAGLYAECLVIKGGAGEAQGLAMLHNLVKNSASIVSAYFLAQYIETGGAFTGSEDGNKIDEAIQAYFKVLQLINADLASPDKYSASERHQHLELDSYYRIVNLYILRFANGFIGSENQLKLSSPSYKRDRDLNAYLKYSLYTLDSLNKTVERANACLSLSSKKHRKYKGYYRQACQAVKDAAQALLPLEEERLKLLADKSCGRGLLTCKEYYELEKEMKGIYLSMHKELANILIAVFE